MLIYAEHERGAKAQVADQNEGAKLDASRFQDLLFPKNGTNPADRSQQKPSVMCAAPSFFIQPYCTIIHLHAHVLTWHGIRCLQEHIPHEL